MNKEEQISADKKNKKQKNMTVPFRRVQSQTGTATAGYSDLRVGLQRHTHTHTIKVEFRSYSPFLKQSLITFFNDGRQ